MKKKHQPVLVLLFPFCLSMLQESSKHIVLGQECFFKVLDVHKIQWFRISSPSTGSFSESISQLSWQHKATPKKLRTYRLPPPPIPLLWVGLDWLETTLAVSIRWQEYLWQIWWFYECVRVSLWPMTSPSPMKLSDERQPVISCTIGGCTIQLYLDHNI